MRNIHKYQSIKCGTINHNSQINEQIEMVLVAFSYLYTIQ